MRFTTSGSISKVAVSSGLEQPVVDVAPGRAPGPALVAQELPGLDRLAALDDDLREMGVDAPVPVAVIDHDHDRQRHPQVPLVEPILVPPEVAHPAHLVVVLAAGREDRAIVGGDDVVAAERREIDAVVERRPCTIRDPHADGPEWQRQPAVRQRGAIAGQRAGWGRRRHRCRRRNRVRASVTGLGSWLGRGPDGRGAPARATRPRPARHQRAPVPRDPTTRTRRPRRRPRPRR